jgi:hypothetical protein
MTILDGAPGFILLGFIMALAAYLRQVSTGAQKMIDELEGGMPTGFPYSRTAPAVRSERLEFLVGMRDNLVAVTHALFFMLVLLAGRMIFYAIARLGWIQAPTADSARNWFDLGYVSAVFVLVFAMWVMHTRASSRDKTIRERAVASQSPPGT